jgi:hypothetical protein
MNSTTNPEKAPDFYHLIAVETAVKQVKNALLISIITGIIIALFVFLSTIVFKTSALGFGQVLEILFVFGLSYGISRYNTVCMTSMFGYILLSSLIGLLTHRFSTASIYGLVCKIYVLYYVWIGIDATKRYHQLMRKERLLKPDLDPTIAQNRPLYSQLSAGDTQTRFELSEPLKPTPELVSLCDGDRAQAQWLLSKIKSKHPHRSVEWCNQQVIEQLTT